MLNNKISISQYFVKTLLFDHGEVVVVSLTFTPYPFFFIYMYRKIENPYIAQTIICNNLLAVSIMTHGCLFLQQFVL